MKSLSVGDWNAVGGLKNASWLETRGGRLHPGTGALTYKSPHPNTGALTLALSRVQERERPLGCAKVFYIKLTRP
jgi:hypothetical protein